MIGKKKFSSIALGAMFLIAIDLSSAASLSNINANDSTSNTNIDEQQRRSKAINKNEHQQASFVLNAAVDKLNRRLDTNQLHHRRIKAQSTKAQQTLPNEQSANTIDNTNYDAKQRRLNQDSLYYKILKEDHINEVGSTYYKSHYDNMIEEATNNQAAVNDDSSNMGEESDIEEEEESNMEEEESEEEENTGWGPFVEHIEDEVDTAHHAHIIHHSATEDNGENVVDDTIICPDGRDSIPNTYCGRDGVECDEGQFCHVHPTDLYAVCCHEKGEDNPPTDHTKDPIDEDTPSPSHTVSPSPSGTSYWPSSYSPSPSPELTSTDMPTSHSGKCTAKDRMIWIANEGEVTRPQNSQYCFEEYPHYDMNGEWIEGCFMDNECLEICWQTEYGYTEECSECFVNIHQCSMNNGCMEVCSMNMTSSECIECDEPCIDDLYNCTGFPQVPNTGGSGKSGKSGSGGGKGGKSGVDGKGGKSG